jgi:hypothetical protein
VAALYQGKLAGWAAIVMKLAGFHQATDTRWIFHHAEHSASRK